MSWADLNIKQKGGLIIGIILIIALIILAGYAGCKAWQLEELRQELVEKQKQQLENIKEKHAEKITVLKQLQQEQDIIILNEKKRNDILEKELEELENKIPESDDQINRMDSTALLHELKSIRAAHRIF
jgi:Tfp pilus assembly protein PilO